MQPLLATIVSNKNVLTTVGISAVASIASFVIGTTSAPTTSTVAQVTRSAASDSCVVEETATGTGTGTGTGSASTVTRTVTTTTPGVVTQVGVATNVSDNFSHNHVLSDNNFLNGNTVNVLNDLVDVSTGDVNLAPAVPAVPAVDTGVVTTLLSQLL